MMLIRGQKLDAGQLVAFLVVANGSRDEKVMRALLERFEPCEKRAGQEKALLMPQDRPALGAAGSLELAAFLIRRFGKDVLLVMDREHFGRGFYGLLGEILKKNQLGRYAIRRRRTRGFREIEVLRDDKPVKLYVVLMGFEKCREEAEAALIREVYGVEVKPEEGAIRAFLESEGTDIYELIMKAGEDKLRKAFPPALIDLLKSWCRDP